MKKEQVFILLGTNLGLKEENLSRCIEEIKIFSVSAITTSFIYKSEAWGYESDNYFLNQCVSFYTDLKPLELLSQLKNIEEKLGRLEKKSTTYEDRIIDIDILLYGNKIVNTEELSIPHPRLAERKFALLPLAELDPELIHPVFKKSIAEMLVDCQDDSDLERI